MIVVSGPTGSGKTTTLYSLLNELDRVKKNIITLEDPIEYGLEGLTQVQVSKKLTFADALRATLRQDPDVILVGEVRDAETADLCIKAASTGHLVLTTIHANGAQEVLERFAQLGMDSTVVGSVLRLASAQRLLKRLCPECKKPAFGKDREHIIDAMTDEQIKARIGLGAHMFIRNSAGCSQCTQGVVGRIPIMECIKTTVGKGTVGEPFLETALTLAWKGEIDVHEALETT